MTVISAQATPIARATATLRKLAPGFLLSATVEIAAGFAAPVCAGTMPLHGIVSALTMRSALNTLARQTVFEPGITFCVKTLLRWAVALLGLRIALGEIAALGLGTAVIVVLSMALTIASGFLLARLFGQSEHYGALAGAGTHRPRSQLRACCHTIKARKRTPYSS